MQQGMKGLFNLYDYLYSLEITYTMKNLLAFVFTIVLLLVFNLSNAKCRISATVKYMKETGWSKKYDVEVTFMSGYELNQATNSFKYSTSSTYATIFWGDGQATVIKLTSLMLCGMEVDCSCVSNKVSDMQGFDQDGDKWNICVGSFCF
jgi:hypothetical protein